MQTQTDPAGAQDRPGLAWTIALHLLPGALGTAFYLLLAPAAAQLGFPPLAAIYSAIPLITGVEVGILYYEGRRRNGRLSLQGVVAYRQPLPLRQYLLFGPLLVAWAVLASGLLSFADNFLADTLFAWLPDWYLFRDLPQYGAAYARPALLATLVAGLALNGILGPVVEELYFRGFLLPRLERLGRWAAPANAVLFSLYHFWTPWQFFSRVFVVLPWAVFARRRQNLYAGLVTHCVLNVIGTLATFALILG